MTFHSIIKSQGFVLVLLHCISVLGVLNVLAPSVRFLNKGPESLVKILFYPVKMFCISGQDNHSNGRQGKEFELLWFIKLFEFGEK